MALSAESGMGPRRRREQCSMLLIVGGNAPYGAPRRRSKLLATASRPCSQVLRWMIDWNGARTSPMRRSVVNCIAISAIGTKGLDETRIPTVSFATRAALCHDRGSHTPFGSGPGTPCSQSSHQQPRTPCPQNQAPRTQAQQREAPRSRNPPVQEMSSPRP